MNIRSIGLLLAVLFGFVANPPSTAHAAIFSFSFTGDDVARFAFGHPVSGIVTGLIFGLADDGLAQVPTSIEITSGPIPFFVGLTSSTFQSSFDKFDVSGGQIVGAAMEAFFPGPGSDTSDLELGAGGVNRIATLSAFDDLPYVSNVGSVTFTNVSAVPEPSTWAMTILGFLGVGFTAYRKKSTLRFA